MSELSTIGKIMQELDVACLAQKGCILPYSDTVELRGYVKDLENEVQNNYTEIEQLKEITKKFAQMYECDLIVPAKNDVEIFMNTKWVMEQLCLKANELLKGAEND